MTESIELLDGIAIKALADEDFNIDYGPNAGCAACPMAKESATFGCEEPPNPADPDEGYYDCLLLNMRHIWGESPKCSLKDWRNRGKEELAEIIKYAVRG